MTKIAIDGPAGAGKSTISKKVAKELGYVYIDTGAMYRAVGLKAHSLCVDTNDAPSVVKLLDDLDIDILIGETQRIILDGEDVTDLIRTPEISMAASNVSKIPEVRAALLKIQRRLAGDKNVVMDGRDVATCILPDAEIKIFLTASVDARAKRRYDELVAAGKDANYEDVKKDMIQRDHNDSTREVSPLRVDKDATVIDTSDLTLEESINTILNHIRVNLR